jgi:hypothetical protein
MESIFAVLATVWEATAHAEYTRTPMCVLSIGFKEAFDNIPHDYLHHVLETYACSDKFRRYVQNMYENATSSVYINGYMTGKFPINCSVRQGCPLSMLLFAIVLHPLLKTLESALDGMQLGPDGHKSCHRVRGRGDAFPNITERNSKIQRYSGTLREGIGSED